MLPSADALSPRVVRAEAVQLENERFDELAAIVFRGAPDAVVVAASDGRYVLANEAAAELFGVSASDLVGRTIAEFAPPEFDTEEIFATFLEDGSMQGEFTIVRPDGSTRRVEYNARADLAPGYHISVLRDLTGRDRLMESLRQSEEQFLRLFMASPVAMAVRLLDGGQYVAANQSFLDLVGHFRADLLGRTDEQLGLWDEAGSLLQLDAQFRERTPAIDIPLALRRKDKTVVACVASFAVLELRAGARVLVTVTRSLGGGATGMTAG